VALPVDRLTFIANLVKALAWPISVLVIALAFKREIVQLLRTISTFRYKDVELQFGRKIESLKAEADQANLPPLRAKRELFVGEQAPEPSQELIYLNELVDLAPKAAVMEAWREVERAIRDASKRLDLPITGTNRDAIHRFKASGRVEPTLTRMIDDLRQLRNSVAHVGEFELSAYRAEEYVKLALRVIEAMRNIQA
jgi:hypothetical protein